MTQQNLSEAGLSNHVSILKKDFFKVYPSTSATVISNPPYDERLKEEADRGAMKSRIGRKRTAGYEEIDRGQRAARRSKMCTGN